MRKIGLARFLVTLLSLIPGGNNYWPIRGKSKQPFFIINAGRSGSTLLNRILNQHDGLFLPSEQYFLGVSIIKYRLFRFLLWRDLVKIIAGELIPSLHSHTWDLDFKPIFEQLVFTKKNNRNLSYIINSIYELYGKQKGKKQFTWGDSTPLNTYYITEIAFLFPKARYIFLIRDGRDVVASYMKGGEAHFDELSSPANSAKYWNQSIEAFDYLRKKGCNLTLIKYEDIAKNPKHTIKTITEKLEIEFSAEMLEFYKYIPTLPFYNEEHHHQLNSPINTSAIGKWKTSLDKETLAAIMPIIGKNLKRFGYLS